LVYQTDDAKCIHLEDTTDSSIRWGTINSDLPQQHSQNKTNFIRSWQNTRDKRVQRPKQLAALTWISWRQVLSQLNRHKIAVDR
jgi:hypothetical protein